MTRVPTYDIPGATVEARQISCWPPSKYALVLCTSCEWAAHIPGVGRAYPTRYEVARVFGDHRKSCPAAAVSA